MTVFANVKSKKILGEERKVKKIYYFVHGQQFHTKSIAVQYEDMIQTDQTKSVS